VSGADGIRWRARQILAATSLVDHRAIPWPDDVRAALAAHLQTGDQTEAAAS
jgi:4-hydroxybenzoyl-CoA thioesterase